MESKSTVERDSRVEVAVTVPGRIPIDIRLALNGSMRALEELFLALAQCSRSDEIEVTGGSCCWTFSQNGSARVHLLIDRAGQP